MKTKICFKLLLLEITLASCSCVYGWGNKETHPALTEKSIYNSVLDNYLKNYLAMDDGVNSDLPYNDEMYNPSIKKRMEKGDFENPSDLSRTILQWLKAGSNIEDEDSGFLKSKTIITV